MSLDFRRGAEAIAEAQENAKKNGSSFKPFTPQIFWGKDGTPEADKYLLFLNPLSDIPQVDLIGFIPVEHKKGNGDSFTSNEQVIARTDVAIGESVDPMTRDWDATPKETNVAVAVELEPTFEERNGRKRPTGFAVKTTSFDRRVRDDQGELTDDYEEVVAPLVGFVTQSPHNFFNAISSYDANKGPIEETALNITRVGAKSSTSYQIEGYLDHDIDLTNLIDYVDGISYLGDDLDTALEAIDSTETDQEFALALGEILLDKRLEELADEDRYNDLLKGIKASLDTFGSNKKKAAPAKKERPKRSSRRSAKEETASEEVAEEKPKRAPRAKKPVETKQTDPKSLSKLEELKKRAAEHKEAAAA